MPKTNVKKHHKIISSLQILSMPGS